MKKYFEDSSKKTNDENFLKELEDIFKRTENNQSEGVNLEDTAKLIPNTNYTSKLRDEYKKVLKNGKSYIHLVSNSNSNQFRQIKKFFEDNEDVFSDKAKTFSEGINEIILILKLYQDKYLGFSTLENELRKKIIKKYSKGCFSNETALYLIDDLIIKLQYDILFMSFYFNHPSLRVNEKRNFLLIYAFVLKQKIFIERIRNGLIASPINQDELKKIVENSKENFGYSDNSLNMSQIHIRLSSITRFTNDPKKLKRLASVTINRLIILNEMIKKFRKFVSFTLYLDFDFDNNFPLSLVTSFLNPEYTPQL